MNPGGGTRLAGGAHTYVVRRHSQPTETPGSCPEPRGTSAAAAATAGTPPGAEDARPSASIDHVSKYFSPRAHPPADAHSASCGDGAEELVAVFVSTAATDGDCTSSR